MAPTALPRRGSHKPALAIKQVTSVESTVKFEMWVSEADDALQQLCLPGPLIRIFFRRGGSMKLMKLDMSGEEMVQQHGNSGLKINVLSQ